MTKGANTKRAFSEQMLLKEVQQPQLPVIQCVTPLDSINTELKEAAEPPAQTDGKTHGHAVPQSR